MNFDGFHPFTIKIEWQNAVLIWCMLQAGPPSLHYYCAVVFHSCIVLPPVAHSSNREYYCCQLKRQSSCVSNFYCTFKFFIWLSLVLRYFEYILGTDLAKAIPVQVWIGLEGSKRLTLSDFKTLGSWRLMNLRLGHLYAPGNIPGTYFC